MLKPHYVHPSRNIPVMIDEYGIHLISHERQNITAACLSYLWDGSYNKYFGCPEWIINNSINVYMICDICAKKQFKKIAVGHSTIPSIKENVYFYSFVLVGDNFNNFDGELGWEIVRHTSGGKFYHMDTQLSDNSISYRMGNINDTLDYLLKSMISIQVKDVNVSYIKSIDQLINKMKLYGVFSD